MAVARQALNALVVLWLSTYTVNASGAPKSLAPAKAQPAAAHLTNAEKCLAGSAYDVCSVNPAYAFTSDLYTQNRADRVYRIFMAQHVLCPKRTTQKACLSVTDAYCAWNQRAQRCEADKYASYLMPLTCPGSGARTYLNCMRKADVAACSADPACTSEHDQACFPKWLVSRAQQSNVTVQSLAEGIALGVITGNKKVLGNCPEARMLERIAELCPHDSNWSHCSSNYCTFDVPPYIPRRPEQKAGNTSSGSSSSGSSSSSVSAAAPPLDGSKAGIPYYDLYPAPICSIDTDRLSSVLHQLLGVSKRLSDGMSAAGKKCKATETVMYDPNKRVAACGYDRFTYNAATVLEAAGLDRDQAEPSSRDKAAKGNKDISAGSKAAVTALGNKVKQNNTPAAASPGAMSSAKQIKYDTPATSKPANSASNGKSGSSSQQRLQQRPQKRVATR